MSAVTLVELRPRRASDGIEQVARFAHNARDRANFLGLQWRPGVKTLPVLESSLGFDGVRFGEQPTPTVGQIEIVLEPATAGLGALVWRGASCTIRRASWRGTADPLDGDFAVWWTGRVETASVVDGRLALTLVDAGDVLRRPLLTRLFGSSGVAVLDAAPAVAQKGNAVPMGWGRLQSVPAILLDAADLIYMLVGQPASSMQGVYDGGWMFTPGQPRASLAALRATAPAAGACDWCLDADGLTIIRPWTKPEYPLTADITVGSAKASSIASAIVAARSALPWRSGALGALDAVQSNECALYLADADVTIAQALDRVFAGIGAWWRVTSAGEVDARPWGRGAAVMRVEASQRRRVVRGDVVMPTRSRSLGCKPNWRTHAEGDIAKQLLIAAADVTGLGALATKSAVDFASEVAGAGKPDLGATRNVPAGVHSTANSYLKGDFVRTPDGTATYIAKANVPAGTALANTTFWDLFLLGSGGVAGTAARDFLAQPPVVSVATNPDGSGGVYGRTVQLEYYDGTDDKTASGQVTYSIVGAPAWASVNAAGLVTLADWGGAAEVQIDASYGGQTRRVSVQLVRNRQGTPGANVTLSQSAAGFTFVDGAAAPMAQSITFTALRINPAGAATFSATPAVTLTGSGNSRTLSLAAMGANEAVVIRVQADGAEDYAAVVRLDRSTAEAGATANTTSDEANRNPSFELTPRADGSLVGWNKLNYGGGWRREDYPSAAQRGRYMGYLFGREAVRSETFNVQAGARIWLEARVGINYGPAGTQAAGDRPLVALYIDWTDGAGTLISNSVMHYSRLAPATFYNYAASFVAPAGATTASLVFWLDLEDPGPTQSGMFIDYFTASRRQPGADVTASNTSADTAAVSGRAAAQLLADADSGKAQAASALSQLSFIADDGYLSRDQKRDVRQQRDAIVAEWPAIRAQADTWGVTRAAATTAYDALITYLATLALDSATDTAINPQTFNGRFTDYFGARSALQQAIAAEAGRRSDFQLATNKPQVGGGNLLRNAGFERQQPAAGFRRAGWTDYNNSAVAATWVDGAGRLSGKCWALRADAQSATTFGPHTGEGYDGIGGVIGRWQPNRSYVLSFWARLLGPSDSAPRGGPATPAGPGGMFLGWNTSPAEVEWLQNPWPNSQWQRYVVRIRWGAAVEVTTHGGVYVSLATIPGVGLVVRAGDTLFIDDIQVEEGDYPTAWKLGPPLADEVIYADGTRVQALQPAQAGADVTGANTSANADALGGVSSGNIAASIGAAGQTADWSGSWASTPRDKLAGIAAGADVTGANTSANANALGGVTAANIAASIGLADQKGANAQLAADAANAIATGKNTLFRSVDASAPPTATRVGDLWFIEQLRSARAWNGAAWIDSPLVGVDLPAMLMRLPGSTIARRVVTGLVAGVARDGDTISFPVPFNSLSLPMVTFGGGGVSQSATLGGSGSQVQRYRAYDITPTSCKVSLTIGRLTASGVNRNETMVPGAAGEPTLVADKGVADQPADGRYVWSVSGSCPVTSTRTEAEPAGGGQWLVYYSWSGSVAVALMVNYGGGFTQVATLTASESGSSSLYANSPNPPLPTSMPFSANQGVTVFGLGQHGGREFGAAVLGSGSIWEGTVSYAYPNGAPPITESATPAGAEAVPYYVLGGQEA